MSLEKSVLRLIEEIRNLHDFNQFVGKDKGSLLNAVRSLN